MNRNFQSKFTRFSANRYAMPNYGMNNSMMGVPVIPNQMTNNSMMGLPLINHLPNQNVMNNTMMGMPMQMGGQQQQQYHQPSSYNRRNCQPTSTYYYAGPPEMNDNAATQIPSGVDMAALLKNRVLNEQRYFLNKSNSKWVSIGIAPGYIELNNTKFTVEIKLSGDNGNVSLTTNGLKTVLALFKGISYFAKFGPPDNVEFERGILMNEFQMGGSPCYKIINQLTNTSVCIALKSIEELLEMEDVIWGIINNLNVAAVEEKFLAILDEMAENSENFFKRATENPSHLEGQLLINFYDFIMTCMEVKKERDNLSHAGRTSEPEVASRNDVEQTQPTPLPTTFERGSSSTVGDEDVNSDSNEGPKAAKVAKKSRK